MSNKTLLMSFVYLIYDCKPNIYLSVCVPALEVITAYANKDIVGSHLH